MIEMIYNELLNERMYLRKLSNGLNCYIIPKKGFTEKLAIISVNYGSADNNFVRDGQRFNMPEGIAHFLEHKMFESDEMAVFDEFNKLGANVNAFTNFSNTAYYFNCGENFEKCLRLLLDFVQKPYFTDENVNKERGIIAQEINMYLDDPFWAVYLNMLGSMFLNYPVNKNIAGTVESINEIDKDMLYCCHDAFYRPENMVLVCIGDLDSESVFEIAEKSVSSAKHIDITRIYGNEPKNVSAKLVKSEMPVARKLFNIGFKDINFSKDTDIVKKIISTKIVLDYALGESSEFFEQLYRDAMIDDPFSLEFICGRFFGFAMISSTGNDPNALREMIIKKLTGINYGNIDNGRFKQTVKKSMGRFIRGFNNLSNVATTQIDMFSKGITIFDIADGYQKICADDFCERLKDFFLPDNQVLSIIEPLQ